MIRKTASRHLANLIGLTICQSAPRRRDHLVVDTARPPQAPWLRPLALPPLPFLFPHTPELLLRLHLVHEAICLPEEVSVALAVAVASEGTLHLVVEEASVALDSVVAEAAALRLAALVVGRAMSSASNKTLHRTKARPLDPAAHFLLKALLQLSARTAIPPPPHTLALRGSHLMVRLFPTLPQVLATARPPLPAHRPPTDARQSRQSPPALAMPTSATTTSLLGPLATAVANLKSTTHSPTNILQTTCTPLSATCLRSSPVAAKLLPRSTVRVSTSSTTMQRSCAPRSRRKKRRSAKPFASGSACRGRARRRDFGVSWPTTLSGLSQRTRSWVLLSRRTSLMGPSDLVIVSL